MSDVSPLLSFLGGSGTSNSQGLQRTVGTAATVGLGLTLLRLLVSATDMNNTNNTGDDNNNNNDLRSRSEVLYHFVKSILRRMLVLQGKVRQIGNGSVEEDDDESEDNVPIIHSGACHCRSVQFEVRSSLFVYIYICGLGAIKSRFVAVPIQSISIHFH